VRDTRYPVSAQGDIDCTEEHAVVLLSIPGYGRAPGDTPPPSIPAPTREDKEPDLESRSKNDLLEMANGLGLEVDRRTSKLKIVAAIRAAKGDER